MYLILVLILVVWGVIAAIIFELARTAGSSFLERENRKSPLQSLYDLIKISGKDQKLSLQIKIAVTLKFIGLLALFPFLPVFLTYSAFEPRLHFVLLCVLLLLPPIFDLIIDDLSLKHLNSVKRLAHSKYNILTTLVFITTVVGKFVFEFKFNTSFPNSTGFPFLLSPTLAVTGVIHLAFGIVAVMTIALFLYKLENFRRPVFSMTPGLPIHWPIGFTGPFLALDMISASIHKLSYFLIAVSFFFSPFNSNVIASIPDTIALQGIFAGFIVNVTFLLVTMLVVSYFKRNKFIYLSLISRKRFIIRILLPILLFSWSLLLLAFFII
ncbi:MAG: hypothetical protein ACXAEU_00930 [Candidatus Hodarchaeales archaeon]|jgi:hypothetical protein